MVVLVQPQVQHHAQWDLPVICILVMLRHFIALVMFCLVGQHLQQALAALV
jgi:hypothetical protein